MMCVVRSRRKNTSLSRILPRLSVSSIIMFMLFRSIRIRTSMISCVFSRMFMLFLRVCSMCIIPSVIIHPIRRSIIQMRRGGMLLSRRSIVLQLTLNGHRFILVILRMPLMCRMMIRMIGHVSVSWCYSANASY